MGGDLRNALQRRALEVQLEHHAETTRQRWVDRDRKVETQYMPAFQEILDRRQRPWVPGFRRCHVRLAWRAKRAVDRRVFVEERQEDDDPFHNRRFDLDIQARPRVVEPPVNGFEAMTAVGADGRRSCAHLEWNLSRS